MCAQFVNIKKRKLIHIVALLQEQHDDAQSINTARKYYFQRLRSSVCSMKTVSSWALVCISNFCLYTLYYWTPLYYSTTTTLFYYYSALSCSYTTLSFIRFANIYAKWKLIYNISSCHTLIRWKTQTNLYLNVYVLSGTILQDTV